MFNQVVHEPLKVNKQNITLQLSLNVNNTCPIRLTLIAFSSNKQNINQITAKTGFHMQCISQKVPAFYAKSHYNVWNKVSHLEYRNEYL